MQVQGYFWTSSAPMHWNRFLTLPPCWATSTCCLTLLKCHIFQTSKHYPSTHGLTYTVLPSRVKNLAQFGAPIKDMCRAFPTYFAQQQKEGTWITYLETQDHRWGKRCGMVFRSLTNSNDTFQVYSISLQLGIKIMGPEMYFPLVVEMTSDYWEQEAEWS